MASAELFPRERVDSSIPTCFQQQAEDHGDRVAIEAPTKSLTYDALNRAANRLAHAIVRQDADPDVPVALLLEHGSPVIIGILGVLKAGRAYLVVDPSFPSERVTYMVDDSATELIVTNDANLGPLSGIAPGRHRRHLNIDELDPHPDHDLDLAISPDALLGVFYTSGSTGRPKGVLRTHRHALHRAWHDVNQFYQGPEDRHSLVYYCAFSASLAGLFSALLTGAAICPFDVRKSAMHELESWIQDKQLTILHISIMVFRRLVEHIGPNGRFPSLRTLILSGGPVLTEEFVRITGHFSEDCLFLHHLASSEVGLIRRLRFDPTEPPTGTVVPVGYPTPDKEVVLLDEGGRRVQAGEVGKIVIRSRFLSPGYWRNPEETGKYFFGDPSGGRSFHSGDLGRMRPDGCLEVLGREDFQVKVRGHRVEPGEVEAALVSLSVVKEAVVVPRSGDQGDHRDLEKRLVAYVVLTDGHAGDGIDLRDALADSLPGYMIPSDFIVLDRLPLTPNGKVDRALLPTPIGRARPAAAKLCVAPRNLLERMLVDIWGEVLGIDEVGIHDSFLDLGGDSLSASLTVSRVVGAVGVGASVQGLLAASTVAEMADVITQAQPRLGDDRELEKLLSEIELMSEEEVHRALAEEESRADSKDGAG